MPVSEKLAFEIFYIEFWHIFSLLFFLGINYYIIIKARKTPLLYSYLATQAMMILWIIAKIFKTVSPDITLRWTFIVLQYFGASFIGGTLFLFAYIYSSQKTPSKRLLLLSLLPCLYSFTVAATNPLHYRFYSSFTFYADSFGPLFYINMGITYLYLAVSSVMLGHGFFRMFGRERIRAYLFLTGIMIPLAVNIFYVLEIFQKFFHYQPLFDYTPIATNASLIFFALAAFRYRFLDIMPIAGTQLFQSLSNAVAVTDRRNHIIAFNNSFKTIYPQLKVGDPLIAELLLPMGHTVIIDDRFYKIVVAEKKKYSVIRLIDKTASENLLSELKCRNIEISDRNARLEVMRNNKKKLAEIKAERYVLQELHDILGHATVLAISACEMEILTGAENYFSALSNVKELLRQGKEEFEHMLSPDQDQSDNTSLLIALGDLIKSTSGSSLIADLTVQGSVFELSAISSDTIYHLCREAVTNTLKHGNASSLNIILRYHEDELELFVIDNGIGCCSIVFGKGLFGMKERVSALDGKIEFHSDADCGFYIYAKLGRS